MKEKISVETTINAPIEKIWEYWTDPKHIVNWAFASDDWSAPYAENNLTVGGKFMTRMEAKDKSAGFDLWGTYSAVEIHRRLAYILEDGREVSVSFQPHNGAWQIIETFEAENENPIEMQRQGWQAILDNFKKYVEQSGN